MPRLPFNPDHMPKRDTGQTARRERARIGTDPASGAMSVSQVTLLIKNTLADHTPTPIVVVGEVSNFSERGHWYLTLKDDENVLNCVMWKSAGSKAKFTPQRGMKVAATGRLDYYGPQARLQMYIDKLEPVGQGELELRFRQLCEELRKLGYFAPERKRPLPVFPQHVAIITSAKGAAVQDVIRTARHRWAGVRLSIVDVQVQGGGAAPDIARALQAVNAHHQRFGIDAIILTRGGGSIEDLWAFNERIVADAVFASQLPIIAAIGHEVDTTIAELVADLRCSTPTQAAERLIPDARAEHQHLDQLGHRLRTMLRQRAQVGRSRLDGVKRHAFFRQPGQLIQQQKVETQRRAARLTQLLAERARRAGYELKHHAERLKRQAPHNRVAQAKQRGDALAGRLGQVMRRRHEQAGGVVTSLGRQLEAVGPRSVLRRGFSYTTDASGRLIRSTGDVQAGDAITTHVADGRFDSRVTGATKPTDEKPPKSPPKTRPTPPPATGEQTTLFGT